MSDWKDLFPSTREEGLSLISPVEGLSTLDLRDEFNRLILGGGDWDPIGQPFILRRMRRNSDNSLVQCYCSDNIFHESDQDFFCPSCFGAGYLFDEELIYGYKVVAASPSGTNASINYSKLPAGTVRLDAIRFFLPYDVYPSDEDKLIEIKLNDDGTPFLPYHRLGIYELMLNREMRGIYGKLEFWVCNGQKIDILTQGSVS